MTLTFEGDLDKVEVNQHAKYVGQGHLVKLMSGQTHNRDWLL